MPVAVCSSVLLDKVPAHFKLEQFADDAVELLVRALVVTLLHQAALPANV